MISLWRQASDLVEGISDAQYHILEMVVCQQAKTRRVCCRILDEVE
jgi:hypothetical protein